MLCRSVYAHGCTAGQKTVENQDWATGPRSHGPAFSKTPRNDREKACENTIRLRRGLWLDETIFSRVRN